MTAPRHGAVRLVHGSAALACAAVLCVAVAVFSAGTARAAAWSCESGGYRVEQTGEDLRAGPAAPFRDSPRFSARAFAEAGFALARKEVESGDAPRLTMERKLTLVSLAGPLLAFRDEAYIEFAGTAHPGGETRFWTIDLRRESAPNLDPDDPMQVASGTQSASGDQAASSGPLLDLRALVPPEELKAALAADPFVRRVGAQDSATLEGLLDSLREHAGAVANACFSVPEDLTTRFAIVGLEPADALVRVGLPGAGPCRYNLTQLGLRLRRGAAFARAVPSGTPICLPLADLPPLQLSFTAQR